MFEAKLHVVVDCPALEALAAVITKTAAVSAPVTSSFPAPMPQATPIPRQMPVPQPSGGAPLAPRMTVKQTAIAGSAPVRPLAAPELRSSWRREHKWGKCRHCSQIPKWVKFSHRRGDGPNG